MACKFKISVGWTVYQTTDTETQIFGGLGICDSCINSSEIGYLVPVMNHWLCPKCFLEWASRANFYSSDVPFEKSYIDYYENLFNPNLIDLSDLFIVDNHDD